MNGRLHVSASSSQVRCNAAGHCLEGASGSAGLPHTGPVSETRVYEMPRPVVASPSTRTLFIGVSTTVLMRFLRPFLVDRK